MCAGGTPIEVWSDAETLARCPANGPVDPTTASTMYNASEWSVAIMCAETDRRMALSSQ